MNKLNQSIKSKINGMRCIEHNKKIEVKTTGSKLSFSCCCDSFKKNISKVIEIATKDYIENELRNALNGY